MALHPTIHAALASAQGQTPYHLLPLAQARLQARQAYPAKQIPVPVASVRHIHTTGDERAIALRVYHPLGTGPHPVLMFFHGSGFVLLDLDTHDDLCRRLCAIVGCVVVSVDYRLAPEHPFPAAPDDCLAATRWVALHAAELGVDPMRLAVAGDSAGGCLAAVTAIRLRDEGGPAVCAQLLLYPVTDDPAVGYASYRDFGSGYGLTEAGMQWFWSQYLTAPDLASHPHAAPMRVASAVNLAPAYIATAEYDVLRDEGEAFAKLLRDARVPVVLQRCAGMNHGFLKYTGSIPEADHFLADACQWLRTALSVHPDPTCSQFITPC